MVDIAPLFKLSQVDPVVKEYYRRIQISVSQSELIKLWVELTEELVQNKIDLMKQLVDCRNRVTTQQYIIVTQEMYDNFIQGAKSGKQ